MGMPRIKPIDSIKPVSMGTYWVIMVYKLNHKFYFTLRMFKHQYPYNGIYDVNKCCSILLKTSTCY